MSGGDGRVPLDASWDEKEAAFEQMVRDVLAEAAERAGLPYIPEEDVADEIEDGLRSFDGIPGYEYLAQVKARREQEWQRRRTEEREAADPSAVTASPPER